MNPRFYEYIQFQKILQRHKDVASPYWSFEPTTSFEHEGTNYPLWKIICENKNSLMPTDQKVTLILVGGVHGLERIGSELCTSLIEKYYELSLWDEVFKSKLDRLRLVFIPFVNPAGIQHRQRSNHRGVDLMRNAPIESSEKTPFLVGGHRHGPWLPWYRGQQEQLEIESDFLIKAVHSEVKKSKLTLSLDIHSGFGFKDQIWFPWAFTKKPFPQLNFVTLLTEYFENIYPYHIYQIEPQSKVYCTHGDLWDYILHDIVKTNQFIPLTLELGSWIWVKKNPLQIFKLDGLFNPIKKHRIKRTLRRHQLLIDFLMRFMLYTQTDNYNKINLYDYYEKGLKRWYPDINTIGSS